MSETIEITLPKLGESIVNATVVQWFKKKGDRVERDEALLEVSTDKVNSEIPSPVAGVIEEILAAPDQLVDVGAPLAKLSTNAMAAVASKTVEQAAPSQSESNNTFLTPAVLRLLQEKKIPLTSIDKIPHTGEGGRLTKKDVEGYCPLKAITGDADRVKMSPLRKAIADNMVKSFYGAGRASLVTEVDVTHLVKFIAKEKQAFLEQHGVKLSITAFVARSIALALQAYPLLNSSLENDTIIMKRNVNLGIAVSVDQGVMVPVIRNAHSLSLVEIASEISELATKARSQNLSPRETQEGTITMTNFGMTGTLIGIPIIRYPEVAIVGLGAITKKVVAMPDDSIAIRSTMMVSLTFDHRVLDGIYGCSFLAELKKRIEETI